jgi:hypothetical protein
MLPVIKKHDAVLDEQRRVAAEGVTSFGVLIEKYPGLFTETAVSSNN